MIKRVGFYREFGDHSAPSAAAPSLREAVRTAGERDEDRIVAYLESSTEIYSVMGAERDVITGDGWIPGAGSLVTDGTWLWPVELAHYVRRHHIALPAEFTAHIRGNGHVSPALSRERARDIFHEHFAPAPSAGAQHDALEPFFVRYLPTLTRASSEVMIKQLGAAGLSVTHPLTGALFGSRETADGRREPLMGGSDVLAASLADGRYRDVEFQCWTVYDQPVTAQVSRLDPPTQKVTVRVADVPAPDREEAVAALVRTLDQHAAHGLGFVIDLAVFHQPRR
ncbi:hypothetical protein [Streptomyces sp. NPDC020362]|uniref:hypothetical protein n=1 Tax=unclassified Streptomyces TaxID=2593676 RepID=UPI0033CDE257